LNLAPSGVSFRSEQEDTMRYTWLGHASIRLAIGNQVLLIDPWLTGNPAFPDDRRAEALADATAILVTHGHFDHASEVVEIARAETLPVYGIVELMDHWAQSEGIDTTGFNKGGTVRIGDVAVTMVAATHSSSMNGPDGPVYAGEPAGFMIAGEGRCVYVSGDTDVMADMAVWRDLHAPEIGILSAGGHFTMDMARAGHAADKLLRLRTVIPVHYKTFPLLEQDADALAAAAPGVNLMTPDVMETIAL